MESQEHFSLKNFGNNTRQRVERDRDEKKTRRKDGREKLEVEEGARDGSTFSVRIIHETVENLL